MAQDQDYSCIQSNLLSFWRFPTSLTVDFLLVLPAFVSLFCQIIFISWFLPFASYFLPFLVLLLLWFIWISTISSTVYYVAGHCVVFSFCHQYLYCGSYNPRHYYKTQHPWFYSIIFIIIIIVTIILLTNSTITVIIVQTLLISCCLISVFSDVAGFIQIPYFFLESYFYNQSFSSISCCISSSFCCLCFQNYSSVSYCHFSLISQSVSKVAPLLTTTISLFFFFVELYFFQSKLFFHFLL